MLQSHTEPVVIHQIVGIARRHWLAHFIGPFAVPDRAGKYRAKTEHLGRENDFDQLPRTVVADAGNPHFQTGGVHPQGLPLHFGTADVHGFDSRLDGRADLNSVETRLPQLDLGQYLVNKPRRLASADDSGCYFGHDARCHGRLRNGELEIVELAVFLS